MNDNRNLERARSIVLYSYLIVPLFSATVSAFHLEKFLRLGNPVYLSVTIAVAYEIANIATMFIFFLLPKINKSFVWASFIILLLMQIVGNIYYSFEWIFKAMESNSHYVSYWFELTRIFMLEVDNNASMFALACIIGIPVPIISLLLTKSVSKYIGKSEEIVDEPVILLAISRSIPVTSIDAQQPVVEVSPAIINEAPVVETTDSNLSISTVELIESKGIVKDGLVVKE